MRLIEEEQLDFDDVSIMPKRSSLNSRSEVDLWRTFRWTSCKGNTHELTCRPIMVANMGTVGTPNMARFVTKRGYLIAMEKHYDFNTLDDLFKELEESGMKERNDSLAFTGNIALSIGLKDSIEVVERMAGNHLVNMVNIDCPNGYVPNLMKRLHEVREILPEAFVIAGTVVTGDIVTDLIMNGASAVRLGVCCGSQCTTSLKTGVRRPIVSMLMECADAAHNVKGYTMLDGGIRCPADWCKATIAGADMCMSGAIFSGTDMADGDIITKRYKTDEVDESNAPIYKEKKFKMYYGMSSNYAQNKFFGGTKNYRTSEGREKLIPYVGSLEDVLKDYEGGMASMMTYIGARKFKDIQRHGSLYKVRHQINDLFSKCEDF